MLQEMSEEEAVELAELEQEIKDLAIDDRHAIFIEDQRIGKMSPKEKYEWVCGQVAANARQTPRSRHAQLQVLHSTRRQEPLLWPTSTRYSSPARRLVRGGSRKRAATVTP